MDARKTLARKLDEAALNADLVEVEAATSKQCWFLAGLMTEARLTIDDLDLPRPLGGPGTTPALSRRAASRLIDRLLAEKNGRAA
ncbi:MAG: hypothetical protein N2688_00025 [Burkholderiaceae bacterium]|nr:hypothetical protein [Burkholderiaceae bacterium]